ncbi:MAG TPA: hypothetical protein ENI85_04550 [Deltaproteobacteria bacterium]|nr:hypothetical protein [Deltaproteobacteria bacterium]
MSFAPPPARYRPSRSAFLPYPELADPDSGAPAWKIVNSSSQPWLPSRGVTDMQARRLFVPLEEGGDVVSLHELAHVRWSPRRFPRVRHPSVLLQAVEDARINLGLDAIGLPLVLDREQRAFVVHLAARDAKSGAVAALLVRAIASLGTSAVESLRAEGVGLPPHARIFVSSWLDRVESRLRRAAARVDEPVAPFRIAMRIARELARDLDRYGLYRDAFGPGELGCCHAVPVSDDDAEDDSPRAARPSIGRGRRGSSARRRAAPDPGRMTIVHPPLTVRSPARRRGGPSAGVCATGGARITRPDRFALDGAIFHRVRRHGGGTVLIDASGSMSLASEDIEAICVAAGGSALVAVYSGEGGTGELRVVADRGRRARAEDCGTRGIGNVIDLPALHWLAGRPAPRFWVSDGGVTGVGDEPCETLSEACRQLVGRARIQQVASVKEAVEALEGFGGKRRGLEPETRVVTDDDGPW